jgi:hypothetical protein
MTRKCMGISDCLIRRKGEEGRGLGVLRSYCSFETSMEIFLPTSVCLRLVVMNIRDDVILSFDHLLDICEAHWILPRPIDLQIKDVKSLIPAHNIVILLSFNACVEIHISIQYPFFIL